MELVSRGQEEILSPMRRSSCPRSPSPWTEELGLDVAGTLPGWTQVGWRLTLLGLLHPLILGDPGRNRDIAN